MMIKGKKTEVSYVDVEINPMEVFLQVYDASLPSGADHLDPRTNAWMKYDYTHPHNGDDYYKPLRQATDEEVYTEACFREVRRHFEKAK